MTATMNEIAKGSKVVTKSGKVRVVNSQPYMPYPTFPDGPCVWTRGLRDGKPFGASRPYAVADLRIAE